MCCISNSDELLKPQSLYFSPVKCKRKQKLWRRKTKRWTREEGREEEEEVGRKGVKKKKKGEGGSRQAEEISEDEISAEEEELQREEWEESQRPEKWRALKEGIRALMRCDIFIHSNCCFDTFFLSFWLLGDSFPPQRKWEVWIDNCSPKVNSMLTHNSSLNQENDRQMNRWWQ